MTQRHTDSAPKVLYEQERGLGREWHSYPVRRLTKAHAYIQVPAGRIITGWIRNGFFNETPVCNPEPVEASVPLGSLRKQGRAYATSAINGKRHKFRVCTGARMIIEKASRTWFFETWGYSGRFGGTTPQLVSFADCEQEIVEHAAGCDADPCPAFVKELAERKSALRSAQLDSGERAMLFSQPRASHRYLLDIARQSAERRGLY